MAIDQYRASNVQSYIGISTDTKPTASARTGDSFFETDTGNLYVWNSTAGQWSLYNDETGADLAALSLAAQGPGTVTSVDLAVGGTSGGTNGFITSVNIAAITAGSLTVTVQGKDGASGTYYTLLASAALATTGFTRLQVGPFIAASANLIAQAYVPRTIRISATVATGPVTATIGVTPV